MPVFTEAVGQRVAVLVRPGIIPMELGLVHQLFTRARSPDSRRLYEVITCAVEPGEIATDADFPIVVAHGPQALGEADTVIVPAAHPDDETIETGLPPALAAALGRIRPNLRLAWPRARQAPGAALSGAGFVGDGVLRRRWVRW